MLNSVQIKQRYFEVTNQEVHETTVNKWLSGGKIPAKKIGGQWFAEEKDVEIFLAGKPNSN